MPDLQGKMCVFSHIIFYILHKYVLYYILLILVLWMLPPNVSLRFLPGTLLLPFLPFLAISSTMMAMPLTVSMLLRNILCLVGRPLPLPAFAVAMGNSVTADASLHTG